MHEADVSDCQHVYVHKNGTTECLLCGKVMEYEEYERSWKDLGRDQR